MHLVATLRNRPHSVGHYMLQLISANASRHFIILTLFHALEVFIDLRHINRIRLLFLFY